MWKRFATLAAVLFYVASTSACLLDPSKKNPGDGPTPKPAGKFKDLSKKDNVLNNLEQAYLQRNVLEYRRLLDPTDYQFFFTDIDPNKNPVPAVMTRDQDLAVTEKLFTVKNDPREVISLDLQLQWEGATWVKLPADSAGGRLRPWWQATVSYTFNIVTKGTSPATRITYITSGLPRCQFSVAQDASGKWHLVEWRDLG